MLHSKVDRLGRVVIPKKYRDALDLNENPGIVISLAGGVIVIAPTACVCRLCGHAIDRGVKVPICSSCIEAIKKEMP